MKDIKVIVATHKNYNMPKDSMYLPLQVGAEGKVSLGYTPDNTGDNISEKNPYFCELTGMYWAWKNLNNDYIGLVHYRRHFVSQRKSKDFFDCVLSLSQADKMLNEADVILPKLRNYYIENLYDHYKHTMYIEPLDEAGEILKEFYPEYSDEFNLLKTRKTAHMFNMFIMKREVFCDYCQWIFDILDKLDQRIDKSRYDSFHARYLGRISELLLDVYINTNNIKYVEARVSSPEKTNWLVKGSGFLKAKFFGSKYGKSF